MKREAASLTLVHWLLLSLLVLSASQVHLIKAYDYGYGHASIIYTSQWNQTDDDLMRAEWACNDIYNLFASRGYYVLVGWIWTPYGWLPIYE
jgi:hypothetical protein